MKISPRRVRRLEIRHAKRWLAAALCAGALLAQQPAVFRTDVNLVRIVATVKTQAGQIVGTLAKDEFEVYDNGVKQPVADFEHQTGQALSVVLMVDTSGSTAKELKYEADSASRFFHALLGEGDLQDTAALYTFNWEVREQQPFTRDLKNLDGRLKLLHGEAGTAMYDAVYLGAQRLEARQGRKVIVVVTDGGDTVSKVNIHKALEAAQLADAAIYAIVVMPITNGAGRNTGGENALEFMANGTGGRCFLPTVGAELDKAFNAIVTELRTQYLLGYYPRNVPLTKDRFHRLEVRVASRFAGFGAQRLLWGSPRRTRQFPGRSRYRVPRQAAEKEALGEATTPLPGKSARAPEQTFEEATYLKLLIENSTPVRVKLDDGEEVVGIIEYYDQSFIRLTRKGEANLFIFKHDIKYLSEES